jgi:Endosomal/lysosomal potassium channel TMEM175
MPEEKEAAHRLAAYSDAVFAVIVTVMVLELEAPDQPAFSALWPLWPTAVSYNVFEREVLARAGPTVVPERTRRLARRRSLVVPGMFTTAMLVALIAPRLGFGLICGALVLHLRPEVPALG